MMVKKIRRSRYGSKNFRSWNDTKFRLALKLLSSCFPGDLFLFKLSQPSASFPNDAFLHFLVCNGTLTHDAACPRVAFHEQLLGREDLSMCCYALTLGPWNLYYSFFPNSLGLVEAAWLLLLLSSPAPSSLTR